MSDFSSPGSAFGVALASPSEAPAYPEITGSPAEWLRSLDWRQFEELVARAYRFQGYEVLTTAHGADGGIDLILTRGTERIFVQCKHWRSQQVGVKVVRELYGLVAAHGATWGIVATSGTYSVEAEEFARTTRTTLLDGRAVAQLVALARDAGPSEGPPFNHPSPVPAPANLHIDPSCPICSAPMALRTVRRGERAGSRFWGCTRYPGCKGVRPAPQAAARPRSSATKRLLISTVGLAASVAVVVGGVVVGGSVFVNALTGSISPAAQPIAAAATFGDQPVDVAYDATAKLIYSANYVSGDVTVADAAGLTPSRTIDVPGKPIALAVDSGRHLLYVADAGAKKIHVVNLGTGHSAGTIATAAKPSDLAIDPTRQRLFVVSKSGDLLEVFNTASKTRVGSRAVPGHPNAVAVDPTSRQLFVAGVTVTVHDAATLRRLQTLPLLGSATALAVDSRTDRVYVTRNASVEEFNLVTHKHRRFTTPDTAAGITIDSAKRKAYVTVPDQDAVVAISVK
jgi:YVTN family beta-propeller protein